MMKRIPILLIFLISAMHMYAETDSLNYESANALYESRNYNQAIALYEKMLSEKGAAEELYYNLGNAYYKNGQTGKAILNYERCLRLNPGNEDAQFNVKLANLRIKDKMETVSEFFIITWWRTFINTNTGKTWSIISIICIWISLIAFACYRFLRKYILKKIFFYATLTACLLFLFFLAVTISKNHYDKNYAFAIVTTPSTTVKGGPGESETNLFLIHEGLKLLILDTDNNWLKIKMPDGNEGWLESTAIEKI